MTVADDTIEIARRPGGEVDVAGPLDDLAVALLKRAGFLTEPTLRGLWVRLPFDMGRSWENERGRWAAEMLGAARYPVVLDDSLRPTSAHSPRTRAPALRAAPPRHR
ncbi:hypothetical protein [Streptomyces gulbargensis]|uniref:hypothetical protein n=1 Tax=Streptomyces gulbargensis TaxID=364901 RepID=UPI0031E8A025